MKIFRSKTKDVLVTLVQDESGQDVVEYGLVVGLLGIGAVISMSGLATKLGSAFATLGTRVTSSV